MEKKIRVALDWSLDLRFSKDIVQFLTYRTKGMLHDDPPALPEAVVRQPPPRKSDETRHAFSLAGISDGGGGAGHLRTVRPPFPRC